MLYSSVMLSELTNKCLTTVQYIANSEYYVNDKLLLLEKVNFLTWGRNYHMNRHCVNLRLPGMFIGRKMQHRQSA